jgi:hypothetical protein
LAGNARTSACKRCNFETRMVWSSIGCCMRVSREQLR